MTVSFRALLGSMTDEISTPIFPDVTKYATLRSVKENLSIRYSSWSTCVFGIMDSWDSYLWISAIVEDWLSQLIDAQPRRLLVKSCVTTLCFEDGWTSLSGETTNGNCSALLDIRTPTEDNLPFCTDPIESFFNHILSSQQFEYSIIHWYAMVDKICCLLGNFSELENLPQNKNT